MTSPHFSLDVDELGISQADATLSAAAGEILWKHYPGYKWMVQANHEQGILDIKCFGLDETIDWKDAMRMGYRIVLRDLTNDPTLKMVVKAGGEILERAKARRGRAN